MLLLQQIIGDAKSMCLALCLKVLERQPRQAKAEAELSAAEKDFEQFHGG